MQENQYSVIIVGGGIVGLVLASALAQQCQRIALVESRIPQLTWKQEECDARVSTLNIGSLRILKELNVWPDIREACYSPLRRMLVWDDLGGGEIEFDCAQVGEPQLGVIVENREIIRVLWNHLKKLKNVDIIAPQTPLQINVDETRANLTLDNNKIISADLIVGTDGGKSWVREHLNMPIRERHYHHDAIVAIIKTEQPHHRSAYQSFLATGPLGVLPLRDLHQVAIVWSAESARAEELMTLNEIAFNYELTNALESKLGMMECVSQRVKIPLMMRHAKKYVGPRIALAGDAAHTIHPLAGQGVNLGLQDAATLSLVLKEAQMRDRDIGSMRVLRRYERSRKGDNIVMLAGMCGFKELFGTRSVMAVQLRSQGLSLINHFDVIKNCFMDYAMRSNK